MKTIELLLSMGGSVEIDPADIDRLEDNCGVNITMKNGDIHECRETPESLTKMLAEAGMKAAKVKKLMEGTDA